MKKTCRVYNPKYDRGGSVSNITQDSSIDPIPQMKTEYFVDWLKRTNQEAQIKKFMEDQVQNPMRVEGSNAIPMAQSGIQYPPVDIFWPDNAVYTQGLNINMPYSDTKDIQDDIQRQQEYYNNNVQFQSPPTEPEPLDYGMPEGTEVDMQGIETPDYFFASEQNAPETPPEYQLDWSQADARMLATMPSEDSEAMSGSDQGYDPSINYYALGQGINVGMNALAWLGERDERTAEAKRVAEKYSNVHRFYQPDKRTDRGDYLQNTKREGEYFRPDQHTRFGYNTKTAQEGMEVNDELELTDDEIKKLIQQGYQFDYID